MQRRWARRVHRLVVTAAILAAASAAGAAAVLAPVGTPPAGVPAPAPASDAPAATPPATRTGVVPPRGRALPGATTPTLPPPRAGTWAASPALRSAAEAFVADPRVAGHQADVEVWVEGRGEVLRIDPGRPLPPASVQKLATAAAVLERLPEDFAFETTVLAPGGVEDGVVTGDLVLVGGGDPTLGRTGPHSLDALAAQVAAHRGIGRIEGGLVVDTTRWSDEVAAPGWLDWHQPRFVGWQSALLADGNRWQLGDDASAPTVANGRWFAGALAAHGVQVTDPRVEERAEAGGPPGSTTTDGPSGPAAVASLHSVGRDLLVQQMLRVSDNQVAESFVRELGRQLDGDGSYASGTRVVRAVTDSLVAGWTDPHGADTGRWVSVVADGSGMSRLDARSARDWCTLLRAARGRSWWPVIDGGLPVAGVSGTLAGRFSGTALAGDLRAKTGTTVPTRALAGTFTTGSGGTADFAIVVTGSDARPPVGAEGAIDALLTAIAPVL